MIWKPPWGSVKAVFFQKGRRNHLYAGIDASPLVKRETQHKTYTLHPSRKRERRRSIYGPASRHNVWSEERFLFSQTQICKDLAWDGLREPVKGGRSVCCTGTLFHQTRTRASEKLKTGKNIRAFDDGSGPAALVWRRVQFASFGLSGGGQGAGGDTRPGQHMPSECVSMQFFIRGSSSTGPLHVGPKWPAPSSTVPMRAAIT